MISYSHHLSHTQKYSHSSCFIDNTELFWFISYFLYILCCESFFRHLIYTSTLPSLWSQYVLKLFLERNRLKLLCQIAKSSICGFFQSDISADFQGQSYSIWGLLSTGYSRLNGQLLTKKYRWKTNSLWPFSILDLVHILSVMIGHTKPLPDTMLTNHQEHI